MTAYDSVPQLSLSLFRPYIALSWGPLEANMSPAGLSWLALPWEMPSFGWFTDFEHFTHVSEESFSGVVDRKSEQKSPNFDWQKQHCINCLYIRMIYNMFYYIIYVYILYVSGDQHHQITEPFQGSPAPITLVRSKPSPSDYQSSSTHLLHWHPTPSCHGGTPIAGCFVRKNPIKIDASDQSQQKMPWNICCRLFRPHAALPAPPFRLVGVRRCPEVPETMLSRRSSSFSSMRCKTNSLAPEKVGTLGLHPQNVCRNQQNVDRIKI